ncbi:MAG: tetratricopeptide repeat protein [Smithellaceae bacterium]
MKLFGSKKSQKANNNNDGHYQIQSHLADDLEFFMLFFTDFEEIKTTYNFKNEPHNLNGLIDFSLFLDLTTNLPSIFMEHNNKDMQNIIHHFVKNSVTAIPKLGRIFKETRIDQATKRIMFYVRLLKDDLKNDDTCNYQAVHEFLKEVFSGQITDEEKIVLTNMLAGKLLAIKSLVMMQTSSIKVETTEILQKTSNRQLDKFNISITKQPSSGKEGTRQKVLNADDYFNRGIEYLFSDNNKAINEFTNAIELDINHKDAYLNRGIALSELKQYQEAILDFEKVRAIDPTMHEATFQTGNCYIELQEYNLAKRCFMLSLISNPRSPLYRYKFGIACSRLKDYNTAIESFYRAIKLGDEIPNVYYERGMAFYELNDYDDFALKDFQHYREYNPDDYRVYYCIARVYGRLKEHDKSLEYMTKAISLNPLWSEAYRIRGITNRILNRNDQAMMDFIKAIEINPEDIKSYILRSMLYKEKGNYSDAKLDLLQALKIDPDNIEAKEKLIALQPTYK